MNIQEIQRRISALNDKLIERGWQQPDCQLHIHSGTFWVRMCADNPSGKYDDHLSEYIPSDTALEALAAAEKETIPDATEKVKQDFVKSLGKLIDKGREIGVDVEFINPLEASMRKLSENILEYSSV